MRTDSQMQAVLDQFAKFGAPPIEQSSPENARNYPTLKNAAEALKQAFAQRGEVITRR